MFHTIGTSATAGLGAGWEEGRVAEARPRVRVDPQKKAAAEGAVRAACGATRTFYDEAACSRFIPRLAKALSKKRDPSRRSVRERAEAGLAAVARGAVADKDGEVCLQAACRGGCLHYPCVASMVVRAKAARGALAALGGDGVTVGGVTVALPSGGGASTGGGGGAGGAGPRRSGKSTRAEREGVVPPPGGGEDFDFGALAEGAPAAAGEAEAAAVLNTRAAVARVSAQVNTLCQAGWDHLCRAEADEVTAALGVAIEGGALPMLLVQSAAGLQAEVEAQLAEVRGTKEGRAREIAVLRANRCLVHGVKFKADPSKRARRGSAGASATSEASDAGEGSPLTALDKGKLWEEFLDGVHKSFSGAAVFGYLSSTEVTETCGLLAKGESMVGGSAERFERVVRAGFGLLEKDGRATAVYDLGDSASFTLETWAFSGTRSGRAVVEGA